MEGKETGERVNKVEGRGEESFDPHSQILRTLLTKITFTHALKPISTTAALRCAAIVRDSER